MPRPLHLGAHHHNPDGAEHHVPADDVEHIVSPGDVYRELHHNLHYDRDGHHYTPNNDGADDGYVVDGRGYHVHPDHHPTPGQLAVDIRAAHDEHRARIDRGDHDLLHKYAHDDAVYERWLDDLHSRIGCTYDTDNT